MFDIWKIDVQINANQKVIAIQFTAPKMFPVVRKNLAEEDAIYVLSEKYFIFCAVNYVFFIEQTSLVNQKDCSRKWSFYSVYQSKYV